MWVVLLVRVYREKGRYWGKVTGSNLDVEGSSDLLRRFALDHVRHRLAGDIQQTAHVQVVSGLNTSSLISPRHASTSDSRCYETHEDQLEQRALVHLEELYVPAGDVVGATLATLRVISQRRVVPTRSACYIRRVIMSQLWR